MSTLFANVDAMNRNGSITEVVRDVIQEGAKFRDAPRQRFKYLSVSYNQRIRPSLRFAYSLPTEDLRALFEASAQLAFYANLYEGLRGQEYVDDMEVSYLALKARHQLKESDVDAMRTAFESYRDFRRAEALMPNAGKTDLQGINENVVLLEQGRIEKGSRRVIIFDESKGKFAPAFQHINAGLQIIVISGCHFASDAAFSIDSDKEISSAFNKANAIWIASGDTQLISSDFLNWKTDHPRQPLKVAFDNADWPEIEFYSIPRFYFFKAGKLFAIINGWNSHQENLSEIRKVIRSKEFSDLG
ncbi:hypothetical protein [Xanthomonas fragariae]|uniref:hypothetical protein n=1 Tax=Xanthomonas fragariae TaxID=48664 RepID=UPI001ABDFFEE|nr:hypothetical protein [Xanthomonas fragariae]UKR52588.1 hypothetical protein K4A87_19295 [Xanthomonas fragariae]